jgi:hypothetical protein
MRAQVQKRHRQQDDTDDDGWVTNLLPTAFYYAAPLLQDWKRSVGDRREQQCGCSTSQPAPPNGGVRHWPLTLAATADHHHHQHHQPLTLPESRQKRNDDLSLNDGALFWIPSFSLSTFSTICYCFVAMMAAPITGILVPLVVAALDRVGSLLTLSRECVQYRQTRVVRWFVWLGTGMFSLFVWRTRRQLQRERHNQPRSSSHQRPSAWTDDDR